MPSIEISTEELKKLTEMAAMAEWVMTAREKEDQANRKPYLSVLQKVYRKAFEYGFTDLVEHIEDIDEFITPECWKKDSPSGVFLREFEDDLFHQMFISKMVERDLKGQKFNNFTEEFEVRSKLIEKYEKELDCLI